MKINKSYYKYNDNPKPTYQVGLAPHKSHLAQHEIGDNQCFTLIDFHNSDLLAVQLCGQLIKWYPTILTHSFSDLICALLLGIIWGHY